MSLKDRLEKIDPEDTKIRRYCNERADKWVRETLQDLNAFPNNVLITLACGSGIPPDVAVFHRNDSRVVGIIDRARQLLAERGVAWE